MIVSYFAKHPEIVKIFDDLERFKDYCRFNAFMFNEADLYNESSKVWNHFVKGHSNWITRPPRQNFKNRNFKKKKRYN